MARIAHGHQPEADPDHPIDEAAGPSAAPDSPSTMAPEETPPASQTMTRPIGSSFSDLGATFNGMARPPMMDASSQSALDQGGPRTVSMAHHTNDLTTVQNNVLAELHTGQFSGAALGHVQAILSDITTAISAANASAGGGSLPGAEQALRASHLSILNAVNTDPVLANPTAQNGVTEPVAAPEAAPKDKKDKEAATAPDDHSAETAELAEAGDAANAALTDENLDAAIAEMEALIAANPELFVGLTVDDADEIVQQIQLELSHINKGGVPPGAAQDGNGDITDIVTGDINLPGMTAQGQPIPPGPQVAGTGETQAATQVAAIAIDDVPVTIVTTEASTIVVDQSQSDTPELAHHLLHTWG